MGRYQVRYSKGNGYAVWCTKTNTEWSYHTSKNEAIWESQTLNGYRPIDGNEQTYGKQIKEDNDGR